jgi:hypothetical protein
MVVATKTILDLEEWDLVLAKLHRYNIFIKKPSIYFSQYSNLGDYFNNFCIFNSSRYHANIQQECGIIVKTIKAEMKSDLIPLAEEKSNHGKVLKAAIRELWSLEYEIEEIQTEFAKGIGSINIAELTDDFVEDVMLQSKPLQGILMAIRLRQKVSQLSK